MSQFDGKLFGGRLYAGKLFGRTRRGAVPPMGPDEPTRTDPRRRIEFTDDDLFRIAAAIILTGALDG